MKKIYSGKKVQPKKIFKGFNFSYSILEVRKTVESADSKAMHN